MLLSKTVNFVHCSSVKRKCFCVPQVLTPQFRRGLLPFKDIPRAPSLPIVNSIPYLVMAGGQTQRHKYFDSLHKKLGPIFINRAANRDIVYIADPNSVRNMFDAEGKFPMHLLYELWIAHLQNKNIKRGLLFMSGQEWRNARDAVSFMNKLEYTDEQEKEIFSITQELMNIWKKSPPKDLKYHLYFWSLECIGVKVLGKRFGFLDQLRFFNRYSKNHLEEENLIKSAFHYDNTIDCHLPVWLRKILNTPSWRNYGKAAEMERQTVSKYVEQSVQECMSDKASEMAKMSILGKLLEDGSLDLETKKRIIIDMVISGAFSVSNASAWALYTLGRHPKIAERVRQQVISAVAEGDFKMSFTNKTAPLLKGALKESLRLYPTAPEISRIITTNTELYGYSVPERTVVVASMHTMGRDPKYFSYPECFMPERWSQENLLKRTVTKNHTPNAFLPFAHRIRNCIGRVIAQTDMATLLIETLKTYEWTNDEVEAEYHYVLTPSKPIELRLKSYGN